MTKTKYISYIFAVFFTFFIAQGCVTRTINIKTMPSGASVYMDDKYIGESPVSIPFTHYGSHKITIEKKDDDGRLVLERKTVFEEIKPPLYERFPIDLFSEILPMKLEDVHNLSYQLEEQNQKSIEERKKEILLNSEELRRKAMELE